MQMAVNVAGFIGHMYVHNSDTVQESSCVHIPPVARCRTNGVSYRRKEKDSTQNRHKYTQRQLKFCLLLLLTVTPALMTVCGPAEFGTTEGCCPMCSAGYFVKRGCTEFTSTACQPCPSSTFTDKPNGLHKCFSCSVCDSSTASTDTICDLCVDANTYSNGSFTSCRPHTRCEPPGLFMNKPGTNAADAECFPCSVCKSSAGLRVKRPCASTSDTLCEPLEGHYCTDPNKDGCRGAVEHTKCKPGQYTQHSGTAASDTVCGDCVVGTGTVYPECQIRRHRIILWTELTCFILSVVLLGLRQKFL